jgi:hypothetical protein
MGLAIILIVVIVLVYLLVSSCNKNGIIHKWHTVGKAFWSEMYMTGVGSDRHSLSVPTTLILEQCLICGARRATNYRKVDVYELPIAEEVDPDWAEEKIVSEGRKVEYPSKINCSNH